MSGSRKLEPEPRMSGLRGTVLGLVIALAAASLAFLVSDYRLFQLTTTIIYAVAILGLALVTGYNG